jgi:site-specific DNA recombinase
MKRTKFPEKKPLQVVGYSRVSTSGQAENGISLQAQKAKIEAWAEANDTKIIGFYQDNGVSGTKADRPGLNEALKVVEQHRAVLVVYSLSRFMRSTRETLRIAERLRKAGANLVSLSERIDTTTAAGKMVFRMLAVLNEFETDQLSERTRAALDYRRQQGKKLGGIVPFGYEADAEGRLSENPEEQLIIRRIKRRAKAGWSYSRIARTLNKEEVLTKTGRPWFPQTVKNVIKPKLT